VAIQQVPDEDEEKAILPHGSLSRADNGLPIAREGERVDIDETVVRLEEERPLLCVEQADTRRAAGHDPRTVRRPCDGPAESLGVEEVELLPRLAVPDPQRPIAATVLERANRSKARRLRRPDQRLDGVRVTSERVDTLARPIVDEDRVPLLPR